MSTLHENDEYEVPINSNLFDMGSYDLNPLSNNICNYYNLEYLKMDENELSKLMLQLKEWNMSFLYQTCVGRY